MKALVLLAHGGRSPNWATPFEWLARELAAAQPQVEVRLAFLEWIEPSLDTVLLDLHARGCVQVEVLPCFLGVGGHVQRDVPPLLAAVAAQVPALQVRLLPALGEQALFLRALRGACLELLQEPLEPPRP